jgi:hypothetical protein
MLAEIGTNQTETKVKYNVTDFSGRFGAETRGQNKGRRGKRKRETCTSPRKALAEAKPEEKFPSKKKKKKKKECIKWVIFS